MKPPGIDQDERGLVGARPMDAFDQLVFGVGLKRFDRVTCGAAALHEIGVDIHQRLARL